MSYVAPKMEVKTLTPDAMELVRKQMVAYFKRQSEKWDSGVLDAMKSHFHAMTVDDPILRRVAALARADYPKAGGFFLESVQEEDASLFTYLAQGYGIGTSRLMPNQFLDNWIGIAETQVAATKRYKASE